MMCINFTLNKNLKNQFYDEKIYSFKPVYRDVCLCKCANTSGDF